MNWAWMRRVCNVSLVVMSGICGCGPGWCGDRLLGTSGVGEIEGSAGGGLTPWALIAGQGSRDQIGGDLTLGEAHTTNGFDLVSSSLAVGLFDTVEFSAAHERFGLGDVAPGQSIRVDVLGLKVRVAGDAVYDQDSLMPQIAVGLQYKRNLDFDAIPRALGAQHASGIDSYISMAKVWLDGLAGRNVFANLTLRHTDANQFGILGFGGNRSNTPWLEPEMAAGLFLADNLAVGGEYRQKPNQLANFAEQSAKDVFVAWFPARMVSITVAWIDLGNIAVRPDQKGWYLSGQLAF